MTKDTKNMILRFVFRLTPENWRTYNIPERLAYFGPGTVRRKTICAKEIWLECFRQKPEAFTLARAREINKFLRTLKCFTESSSCDCGPYGRQRGFVYRPYLDDVNI